MFWENCIVTNGPGAIELADAAVSDALRRIETMGDVEVVGNKLTAGGIVLNDVTALVDAIKGQHGFGCTIFQGNVRVATTAFAKGKNERALGTRANEKVTQQVYRLGQRFEGITRTIGKDWVIVYIPLRSHTGQIAGMLAAYRELEDFFGDLTSLDDTHEAVFLQTLDGRVSDANRAACDMLRLSKTELVGRSMAEFSEGAADRGLGPTWPALGDEPLEADYKWRAADAFEFVAKQYISRIEYMGVVQVLTIALDCTEEFVAREELRLLNNELTQLNDSFEEKVSERTRSLQ
ncbi:MAG: PAS domain S-box-containing protein, partial [Candidatus Latescibacterota bacterium]